MAIKRKEIERKKEKDKFLNRKAFKENKVRWNNEDDIDLSTEEFMDRHEGLIKKMVFDKLRPMGLGISSQYHDDMLSDAYLRVYTRDKLWKKGMKGGKSRKRWMVMCLSQGLHDSAYKIIKLRARAEKKYNEVGKGIGYSSNIDGTILSLIEKFTDTLDVFQKEVFLARVYEEETVRDVAKRWHTRKANVIEEFRCIKEEFQDFIEGEDSSIETSLFGGADSWKESIRNQQ